MLSRCWRNYIKLADACLRRITRTQEAMWRLFRVQRDSMAPVVRTARDGERKLTLMRWGFPPPPNLGTKS